MLDRCLVLTRRALFIGRFQPFHLGHLHAIDHILRQYEEVVIVVAAAQYSYTVDNPFTAGERVEMIKLGIEDLYFRTYIIPVDNVPSNYEWPRHVLAYVPRVNAVFSNNEFVRFLFRDYGLEVYETPLLPGISGTAVRKAIAEGLEWKNMVPKKVALFIEEINGVERIKALWKLKPRMTGERI